MSNGLLFTKNKHHACLYGSFRAKFFYQRNFEIPAIVLLGEVPVNAFSVVELTGCELITATAFVPVWLVYRKQ